MIIFSKPVAKFISVNLVIAGVICYALVIALQWNFLSTYGFDFIVAGILYTPFVSIMDKLGIQKSFKPKQCSVCKTSLFPWEKLMCKHCDQNKQVKK